MTVPGPLSGPPFRTFWAAETVSGFGSYVTLVAVSVLVVDTLDGSAADVGLVSAARWLPYLLFGLVAGVLVDRVRRRPVLVVADLARAALLLAVPALHVIDRLSVVSLAALLFGFGLLSLAGDAAGQSFLPRLVPTGSMTAANARLDQSDAAAQTTGPALGGALVSLLGAPLAVLVDAVSFVASGLAVASLRVDEPPPPGRAGRDFRRELTEGIRWVYRHRTLTPLAVGTHAWFLFFGMATTAFTPFALRSVGLGPLGLGVVLSCAGVGALLGAGIATRLGTRLGVGRVTLLSWVGNAVAVGLLATAPAGATGGLVVGAGQLVLGLTMGIENANTLGYRQVLTPDALQGRTNTTIRSVNRAMIVVGAPLGGVLADTLGYRPTLWISAAGLLAVAAALAASPFRSARL